MDRTRIRQAFTLVSVIALVGLLSACAHNEEAPPPPPAPPPAAAPPPPPPPPPAAEAPAPGWTVTARINLHAGPSVRSKVLAKLAAGDQVQATGKKTRVMTQVSTPGGEGWVLTRYLKPS